MSIYLREHPGTSSNVEYTLSLPCCMRPIYGSTSQKVIIVGVDDLWIMKTRMLYAPTPTVEVFPYANILGTTFSDAWTARARLTMSFNYPCVGLFLPPGRGDYHGDRARRRATGASSLRLQGTHNCSSTVEDTSAHTLSGPTRATTRVALETAEGPHLRNSNNRDLENSYHLRHILVHTPRDSVGISNGDNAFIGSNGCWVYSSAVAEV